MEKCKSKELKNNNKPLKISGSIYRYGTEVGLDFLVSKYNKDVFIILLGQYYYVFLG